MRDKRIIVGNDHAGLVLKRELVDRLRDLGWQVEDVGCASSESVDYPDFAFAVARQVAADPSILGLLICGSGVGMCIAANKVAGIRAALCHDPYTATVARAHNNANILCLGGRVIGPELAKAVLASFLGTAFEGGRHQRRLDRITQAESTSE